LERDVVARLLLAFVVACGAPVAPPSLPSNTASTALAGTCTGHRLAATGLGGIEGLLTDVTAHAPAVAATVIATSPSMRGEQAVISDEHGRYVVGQLPPGTYLVMIYYDDKSTSHAGVHVGADCATALDLAVRT
jgi:carboxypeptidase family protein